MIQKLGDEGIRVPGGFATTATAYREFLALNDLEEPIRGILADMEAERQLRGYDGSADLCRFTQ